MVSDDDAPGGAGLPDSAMASGTDAGEPGEQTDERDLSEEDRQLLAELRRRRPYVVERAVEELPEVQEAAAADVTWTDADEERFRHE